MVVLSKEIINESVILEAGKTNTKVLKEIIKNLIKYNPNALDPFFYSRNVDEFTRNYKVIY